jgi:dTDP-4-amino-4,6-dideoxygalactose transaminase
MLEADYRQAQTPKEKAEVLRSHGFDIKDFPNAYNQFKNEITLPLHSRLTDEEADYILTNFKDIVH